MTIIQNPINISNNQDDEQLISEFGSFIALALHHAKLYDKLRRSENDVAVASELKSYYGQAKQEEVELILSEGPPQSEQHQDISTQM